jgi:hypothetical protein
MKIGIVCDNYKLGKFKKELAMAGFQFKNFPFTNGTTTIKVECEAGKSIEVKAICEKVEAFYKANT